MARLAVDKADLENAFFEEMYTDSEPSTNNESLVHW